MQLIALCERTATCEGIMAFVDFPDSTLSVLWKLLTSLQFSGS